MKRHGKYKLADTLPAVLVFGILITNCFTACESKPAKAPEAVIPDSHVQPQIKETKRGVASYYGRAFDGKKTTFGEVFDSKAMIAAHPTYPAGTIVRVTNLATNDTVHVRIADRGPTLRNQKEGIIIDLSQAAAAKINMVAAGREKVQVDVLKWGNEQTDADSTKR